MLLGRILWGLGLFCVLGIWVLDLNFGLFGLWLGLVVRFRGRYCLCGLAILLLGLGLFLACV